MENRYPGRGIQGLSEQRAKGRQVQVNRHCDRLITRATNGISNAPGLPVTRRTSVPWIQDVQALPAPPPFSGWRDQKESVKKGCSKRTAAPKARGPLRFDVRPSRDCAHSGELGGFKSCPHLQAAHRFYSWSQSSHGCGGILVA